MLIAQRPIGLFSTKSCPCTTHRIFPQSWPSLGRKAFFPWRTGVLLVTKEESWWCFKWTEHHSFLAYPKCPSICNICNYSYCATLEQQWRTCATLKQIAWFRCWRFALDRADSLLVYFVRAATIIRLLYAGLLHILGDKSILIVWILTLFNHLESIIVKASIYHRKRLTYFTHTRDMLHCNTSDDSGDDVLD